MIRAEGFTEEEVERDRLQYKRSKGAEAKDRKAAASLALAVAEGQTTEQAERMPSRVALFRWLDDVREGLAEYVIRRTTESLDHTGKPISNLPPIVTVRCVVTLTAKERAVQLALAEQLKGNVNKAILKKLAVSLFLLVRV